MATKKTTKTTAIHSPSGRMFVLHDAIWHGDKSPDSMPNVVVIYGSGDMGPGEVAHYVHHSEVKRLKAELDQANMQLASWPHSQQHPAPTEGPSDEEIREQFCRVDRARVMAAEPAALVHLVKLVDMVARRAGVRL